MQQLKSILLIDDNHHDNFFHKLVIDDLNCAEEVISIQDSTEALEYLLSRNNTSNPLPELIFVDLNMPMMNGFELLEAYRRQRAPSSGRQPVIIMLSTSLNPEDQRRVELMKDVALFANKPLSGRLLSELLSERFSIEVDDALVENSLIFPAGLM